MSRSSCDLVTDPAWKSTAQPPNNQYSIPCASSSWWIRLNAANWSDSLTGVSFAQPIAEQLTLGREFGERCCSLAATRFMVELVDRPPGLARFGRQTIE